MSNCAINIRIWYWHLQVTFSNEWSFSINKFLYNKHFKELLLAPAAVYDFRPWKIKFR
jgi:hypothetical protein